jgi:hypothetical protein
MTVPNTYFEWADKLEQFARGDDSVLSELQQGTFAVDAGTVYRFYNKAQEAYVERKKRWLDKFNRLFQVQYVKTENDISIVLQDAKTNLQPIAKFIQIKAFPDDLRETLKRDFEGFVAEIRKNIRESVIKKQPRNEKMLLVVNTFNFFDTATEACVSEKSSTESTSSKTPSKRRILF